MKKITVLFALAMSLFVSTALATDGDQMLGITASQWARGGAIVAAPADIPSMIYNPAAIGELKFNKIGFDLSLGILNPPREITSVNGTTESNANAYLGMGNGFSARKSDKIVFGIAAGGVSGLGVDFPSSTFPDNPQTPFAENTSVVTKKGLLKITPTVAINVNDKLTVGVSLQIGQQSLALKTPGFTMPQTDEYGFGGAFGAIYHITPKLQAGLSYTSEMDISEYTYNGTSPSAGEGEYNFDMDSPQSAAFGLAFNPNERLLVEADVKWYNFSNVMDVLDLKTPTGSVIPLKFGWDDQMVYALGLDFAVKPGLVLKAGYNYGKSPIGEEDVDSNLGSIAVVEHHFSVGVAKNWNKALCSTLSYTHGLHNEVESSATPNKIAAEQNIVFLQFSFRM
ncbi:MAG: OmpP1/FadL family transporter [Calditrichaceae bacterium]